jgi:tape measure domain-containing protein
MANNRVDIQIRAVDQGVKQVFDLVAQKLKTGKVALEAYNQAMGKTQAVAAKMSDSLKTAFAGVGAGVVVQSLFQAGVQAQNLDRAFTAILGSSDAAAAELDFIRSTSDRLGLSFYDTANAYKGIAAAAAPTELAGEGVRKIFIGIASAASALGMSTDDASGALRAIGQMISKGKIQAEELRAQLGERLYGAFQLMAEASGVTTEALDKMLVKGEVSIDMLGRFAEILTERYGPAAEIAATQAVGALARWQTAWWDLKVTLANSGFLENATNYLTTLTNTMKDPAVQKAIAAWAKRFFELTDAIIKTVWEYKGLIASTAGIVIGVKIVDTMVRTVLALGAAFKVLTGMSIAAWFTTAAQGMTTAAIAAGGLKTVIGALAGVFLAWEVGWQIGTLLNKFDIVKTAGTTMAHGLTMAWLLAKKAWVDLTNGDSSAIERQIEIARTTYTNMIDEIDGKTKKAGDSQKKVHQEVAGAAVQAAAKQKEAQAAALDEMKKKYQQYADEVKRLQDDIAGRERSLAEQLRDMARSGMSDIGAWQDRKAQAEEYAAAAKRAAEEARQAFAAGNADIGQAKAAEAVGLYDKAKDAAAELNREVKDGDQTIMSQQQSLQTALAMVEEYGKGALDVQKELQSSLAATAQELDKQSGGELSKQLPEIAKQFASLTGSAEGLAESAKKFNDAWNDAWNRATLGGQHAIAQLEKDLKELTRDRHIKIYVEEVVKKASGGVIQKMASGGRVLRNMLRGGFFPGFGGGDRRHVVAEDGEYMLDKDRVKHAGLAAVRAFHAGRYDVVVAHLLKKMRINAADLIRRQVGGVINSLPALPKIASPFMAAGGMVASPAAAGASGDVINLTLNYSGSGGQADAKRLADMVMTELQRQHRRASR